MESAKTPKQSFWLISIRSPYNDYCNIEIRFFKGSSDLEANNFNPISYEVIQAYKNYYLKHFIYKRVNLIALLSFFIIAFSSICFINKTSRMIFTLNSILIASLCAVLYKYLQRTFKDTTFIVQPNESNNQYTITPTTLDAIHKKYSFSDNPYSEIKAFDAKKTNSPTLSRRTTPLTNDIEKAIEDIKANANLTK